MKKLLSVILAVCMMLTMATSAFAAYGEHEHTFKDGKCTVCGHPQLVNPFVDVPEDAWYHDEIVEAVYTGIINGKSETIFAPDDLLTYAEAVKLAACMSQVYLNGNVTLTSGTPWYQPYADYCRINNITTKNYDYNANATRAGYIEIFANALPNSAFEDINNIPDGSILDVKTSASYAHYVYKLYRAGIVTGVDALHNCKPEDNIKRSEVAAIISRMMNEDKRVKFNMGGSLSNEGTLDDDNINKIPATEIKKEPVNEPEEEPNDAISVLTIYKQPEGSEAEEYGSKYELEVQVYGGKAPYSYQWFYYTGHRNNTDKIANGDYVKDVTSDALVLSVEKENTLLGRKIYCEITDSEGTTVTTDAVKVYYDAVMWAANEDITGGTSANTFSPDVNCSRGQVVTFLHRMIGSPEPAAITLPFADVKTSDYFYKPAKWAYGSKITGGTSDTTFSPDVTCTRGQVVTFLWRTAGQPEAKSNKCNFTDVKSDSYYYKAVLWAVEQGITGGTSATTFSPEDSCTRGQVVTFLYRFINGQ